MNEGWLAAAVAAALTFAAPVEAADIAIANKAPPIAAATPWTGFYFGLDVGMQSTKARIDLTSQETSFNGGPFGTPVPVTNVGSDFNNTKFRPGIYAGYNWQFASWVIGLDGDVAWTNRNDSGFATISILQGNFGPGTLTTKWDASARARLGYLVTPSLLFYVAGGAAWQSFDTQISCGPLDGCRPNVNEFDHPVTAGGSFTKTGWTIGAGGEAALWSNWIARAEYRYANFGTASFNAAQRIEAIGQPIILDVVGTYTVKVQTHTALFGIAYKFGN